MIEQNNIQDNNNFRKSYNDIVIDLMTLTCVCTTAYFLYLCSYNVGMLVQFVYYIFCFNILIWLCGLVSRPLTQLLGTNKTNASKTHEQIWQTVVHISMTWLNWGCWTEFIGNESTMFTDEPISLDANIETVFIAQIAVWIITAARHRFVIKRGKDYNLMFAHHVITLILVVGSYAIDAKRSGALALLLHDSSDIIVDVLRLSHDLELDAESGIYLAEISFVVNLITWAYMRLYRYPIGIHEFYDAIPHKCTSVIVCKMLLCLLYILYFMHWYWYYLFGRILYKLLTGVKSHEAGRDYEGDSMSEDENEDEIEEKNDDESDDENDDKNDDESEDENDDKNDDESEDENKKSK